MRLFCLSLNCKFISSVLHLYPPLLMISDFGVITVHGRFRIFTVYIPLLVSLVICGIFVSFCCLFFSAQRSSFSICCKAGLVLLNSLSFCLSEKVFISPSNLNESLAGQSILGWRFSPFITLSISCHSLLACRVSAEKNLLITLLGFPCMLLVSFAQLFSRFSLCL